MMSGLLQDVHYAVRSLASRPMYAVLTIAVLSLAIGANATVFSIYNSLFLRALPYDDDARLVMVYNTYPGLNLEFAGTSIPDYLDRRDRAESLESLAIYTNETRTLGVGDLPERIRAVRTSPSLFATLGVMPELGRAFTADEAVPGNERVVIVSTQLWQTRFGGRADFVGSDIFLDGEPHTVVGVMPERFSFPDRGTSVWLPFAFTPEQASDGSRGQEFSLSVGRMRPGATIAGLNAEFDAIVRENLELGRFVTQTREGLAQTGFTGRAQTLRDARVGDARQGLLLLQGIVLAVLLIACANVANFQLARIENRRRELSVRRALGASALRVGRLVILESLLLALAGAAAGLGLAYLGLDLVRALGLDASEAGFDYVIDATVLAFAGLTVVVAALVSALLPLWAMLREDFVRAMTESTRPAQGSRAGAGLRNSLVVVQVAVCVTLLVAGGLLFRSFSAIQQDGPGFSSQNLWTGTLAFPAGRYTSGESRAQFLTTALERLNALPGVESAAFTSNLPFGSPNSQGNYQIEDYSLAPGQPDPHAQQRAVSAAFFGALGIPILQGRGFEENEAEPVVIVDELFVERYFPDGNVIGQRIREDFGPEDPLYTIIGVVPAVKHASLGEAPDKETLYWHYAQNTPPFGSFVLKSLVPPESLTREVGAALREIDALMPIADVQTLQRRVADSLGPQRAPMVLVLLFAFSAFALAMVGVYGILTWAVTHRIGEIGVRMALGARAADIVRMVLGHGGRLVGVGLVIGAAGAIALGRVFAAQIPGIEAFDPVVFVVVVGGLLLISLITSWLPARRAARIDPMTALRDQ